MEETAFSSPLEVGIGSYMNDLDRPEDESRATRNVGHSNQAMLLEHCTVVSRKYVYRDILA